MKLALAVLAGIVAIALLGLATSWFGLVTQRPMAQYAEETSRLTESNSRRRIDGVNAGLASLCLNMRREPDPTGKRAFASMILTDANSFQRPDLLTPDNQACVAEARSY